MFQAMILMVHGVTFIFRVTESNMLTSSTDVQLNTKYSYFLSFKHVLLKKNFHSFKPLTLLKLIKLPKNQNLATKNDIGILIQLHVEISFVSFSMSSF